MTIRLDMLRAASRARGPLSDSAARAVSFLTEQINQDGGFKDRAGQSDLYYTVFGVEALIALKAEIPARRVLSYLEQFGDGASLDFVHLAALARCRADIAGLSNTGVEEDVRRGILKRMERYRSADGGYSNSSGARCGTSYGCFLALGAYQDLDAEMADAGALVDCVASLRTSEGAYSNDMVVQIGSTPATAAAVAVLHYLNEPVSESTVEWLLSQLHPNGGFVAVPLPGRRGEPDLLSTATALHVLSLREALTREVKEKCLAFIDGLRSDNGGYCGSRSDRTVDCEYTYYGLLSLGHLSE